MTQLLETKSLLAKLMATENLHIEQRNVSTASFDVKNRILTVPVLDSKIDSWTYDLFMGHEVGHALYTPFEEMLQTREDNVNMSVLNVVEDSRIERKIKYKYPGIRHSFVKAYNALFAKNFFATEGKNLDVMNFIDRINLHCKVGAGLNIKFNDEERVLLDEVESTNTYEEVVELTKRITKFMREEMEKQLQDELNELDLENLEGDDYDESDEEQSEDGKKFLGKKGEEPEEESVSDKRQETESEEGENSDEISKGQEGEETEEENQDDSSNSDNESGEDEGDEPNENNSEIDEKGGRKPSVDEEDIRSHTDDAYRENESQLFAESNENYFYMNLPKINVEPMIIDYKETYKIYAEHVSQIDKKWMEYYGYKTVDTEGFQKFRKESMKVVSYMVKEFELRKNADQMKKASTAKTGDLNMDKIFSYKFNEDIFKKITVTPNGKSHGLIMFLDWSGSMTQHIDNTVKQLMNLVMFCKKVNIPYEVYSFTDSYGINSDQKINANEIQLKHDFRLVNIFSSRMSASEFAYAAGVMLSLSAHKISPPSIFYMNGTPLNEVIVSAMEIIPQFQKKYRLQIVNTVFLTDGEGNPSNGYYDAYGNLKYLSRGDYTTNGFRPNVIVLTDPKTRHQVRIKNVSSSYDQTAAFIKLLKLRTNCNIIGFYILSSKQLKNKIYTFFPDYESHDKVNQEFKKEKHAVATSIGFDEYYLLRSDKGAFDEEEEFKTNAKTTKSLVTAFSKYAGNKISNRVILNRFIGLIS
jgi:hypothetical protein